MKPLPTLMRPLASVDLDTGESGGGARRAQRHGGRRGAGGVAEACVAWELAAAARDKFGGDALGDFVGAYNAYLERIDWQPRNALNLASRAGRVQGRGQVDARPTGRGSVSGARSSTSTATWSRDLAATIPELFEQRGETAFRMQEEGHAIAALRLPDPAVIALGGGAVQDAVDPARAP
jgi:hypothetical protein